MKKYYILFALLFISELTFSQTYQWVKHNTVSIPFNPDNAVVPSTTDPAGNFLQGSLSLYKQAVGNEYCGDIILRKYNNSGTLLLSKTMTGKANITRIETDAAGDIYFSGTFVDTLFLEPGNFIVNPESGLTVNSYLVKLTSSGGIVWKKNITAIYGNGASVSSFRVKNSFIIAGIDLITTNAFIKKFDLSGNEVQSISHINIRELSSVDMDASGNFYAGGSCSQGNVTFGGSVVNCPYIYSLYFVKYNSAGTNTYAKLVEDVTFERPDIVCDNSGNMYASGDLNSDFQFGSIHMQGPQWVYDFYVTKIGPSGTFLWANEVPHSGGPITGDAAIGKLSRIRVDNSGNVYLTGFQRGSVNWGSFTTTASTKSSLVLKYNNSGTLLWGKTTTGSGESRGDAISLDNSGNIFISGNFSQTVNFDTIAVVGTGLVNPFASKLSNAVTGISNNNTSPLLYSLTNYPNPFNPSTNIKFEIPKSGFTTLKVYNSLGQIVATLVSSKLNSGSYVYDWDAAGYTSGVYFYTIESGLYRDTKKMILLK